MIRYSGLLSRPILLPTSQAFCDSTDEPGSHPEPLQQEGCHRVHRHKQHTHPGCPLQRCWHGPALAQPHCPECLPPPSKCLDTQLCSLSPEMLLRLPAPKSPLPSLKLCSRFVAPDHCSYLPECLTGAKESFGH